MLISSGQSIFFPAVDCRKSFVNFPRSLVDKASFIFIVVDPLNSQVLIQFTSTKKIEGLMCGTYLQCKELFLQSLEGFPCETNLQKKLQNMSQRFSLSSESQSEIHPRILWYAFYQEILKRDFAMEPWRYGEVIHYQKTEALYD